MPSATASPPPPAPLRDEELGGDLVQALARGLQVIRAFDARRPRLALADVARETGLTRATARRSLLTLHHLGYVAWDGKFFSLTPQVLTLGYAYLSSSPLPTVIQPALSRITERTQESCSACVLDGDEAVIVARAASPRILSADLGVGSRFPLSCTSVGRVLLAELSPAEQRAVLERTPPTPRTEYTVTDPEEVLALLRAALRDGYALADQELEIGLRSISVPVRGASGRVVAALTLSTQVGRVSAEELVGTYLPLLQHEAEGLRPLLSA
ncbi:IclR family transcriptional regulator domain-containing protein [Deinococcus aestuarii]|uniref:IclR family transcriptional regulator domain-containing protein n=1 Tax=Deinococcus aestuarii TaxID=2774531 RepID=UPI001C0C5A97|nr:IclR family transcriptional regulator C-terminal domain-containing protein [Deinococcus aestuarii]